MKKELEAELYRKYPKIFKQKDDSPQTTCMCFGLPGDGWYNLIDDLCAIIDNHIKNIERDNEVYDEMVSEGKKPFHEKIVVPYVEATQVKEKFGTLRFYYDGGDSFIDGAVALAEHMSCKICETCGNPGKIRGKHWLITACDKCAIYD